jgi:hypothetical protein
VFLQEINVRWHKASRGAPRAVARNRVPEAHTLPANPPNTPWPARFHHSAPKILPPPDSTDKRATDIFLHHVVYGEDNQFQMPRVQYWIALRSGLPGPSTLHLPNWNVPPFTLTGGNDTLLVQFEWGAEVGAPLRNYRHRREQATLATGQWMQVRYNGRHIYGEDGTWYYEKHAVNIGFSEAFVPALFVTASPDYQITDFADLH